MARINIEESWWTDPRRKKFIKLLGSEELADGIAVGFWRQAQNYWTKGRRGIPEAIFKQIEASSKLIEAGLAYLRENEVFAAGSFEAFEWLEKKRISASNGGKKSAEVRRKNGNIQPKTSKQTRSTDEAKPSNVEPSSSFSSSFSSSLSSSNSIRGSDFEFSDKNSPPNISVETNLKNEKTNNFIAFYCEEFKKTYGTNPTISGRDAGIAKRIASSIGTERAKKIITAYFAMRDTWFVKKRHDLPTLEGNLNAVVVYAETGNTITHSDLKKLDERESVIGQLERIRKGSV